MQHLEDKTVKWLITKNGRTRSEIAREREARPEVKLQRKQRMLEQWKDKKYRQNQINIRLGKNTLLKGVPLSEEHINSLRSPRELKNLTIEQRAWLGAFVEADGYINKRLQHTKRKLVEIGVHQLNIEPISAILRITGTGTVSWDKRSGVFKWQIARRNDVVPLLEMLFPYSEKAQEAYKYLCKTLDSGVVDFKTIFEKDSELWG